MSQLFVMGDTHGDIKNFVKLKEECDIRYGDSVVVCGDFGFIWEPKEKAMRIGGGEYWLDWLNRQKWTTFFIDGNHENFSRLKEYPVVEYNKAKVHEIRNSVFHIMRGEVIELEGYKIFCYGGARSVDRVYREPGVSWWPEEIPSKEEYENAILNLRKNNNEVDYIITHEMPDLYCKEFYGTRYTKGYRTAYELNDFLRMCSYKKWFCGHHHFDGAIRPNFQVCFQRIYKIGEKNE